MSRILRDALRGPAKAGALSEPVVSLPGGRMRPPIFGRWLLQHALPSFQERQTARPTQGLDYGSTSAKNKGWFSAWPEFYMPMCRQCHGQMDGAKASAELAEYREWKYATRMTLADITVVKAGINA